jgi:hypothetical protein
MPEKKRYIFVTVLGTLKDQPYRMQPIAQSLLPRLASDEFLDDL